MKLASYSNVPTVGTKSINDLLLDTYQRSIASGELEEDPFQKQVILELQHVLDTLPLPHKIRYRYSLIKLLFHSLRQAQGTRFLSLSKGNYLSEKLYKLRFLKKLLPSIADKSKPIKKGLYLYGGVGRGKTLLVDCFFKLAPIKRKLRLHFHRFMQLIHEELDALKHVSNPLKIVANKLAKRIDLLCLDEIHVNDIADAMLLAKLFEHLFDHGIVLVTTSNYPPQDLYKNGLQRERFIPVIQLLESYTKVVEIGGEEDYRLKMLEQSATYHLSSGELSECRLKNYFHQLAAVERHQDRHDIIIKQRSIPVKMWADGIVWFAFEQLCNTARSTEDYIQIANIFHTVLISDIPIMKASEDDVARRFINMIDEFYDLRVNLIVSATAQPQALYTGMRLKFEFQRTASRLYEMQSAKYMATKHLS